MEIIKIIIFSFVFIVGVMSFKCIIDSKNDNDKNKTK